MAKTRSRFLPLLSAMAVVVSLLGLQAASAQAAAFTPLALQNGWANYGNGTQAEASSIISNQVTLHGAIYQASGSSPVAFTLPSFETPSSNVYVPVDLCNGDNGRLFISTSGAVTVQAETSYSDAQCFTSLEGVTFALSAAGTTPLTLSNGWTNGPYGTASASARIFHGIVRLQGAVSGGSSAVIMTLPGAFRPASEVYTPVDLCNSVNGRLQIDPNGTVTVESDDGTLSTPDCFTSLDGASFALSSASGFGALSLVNGWTTSPFSTATASSRNINGVVEFKGAIASGTTGLAFTLPASSAPNVTTYVPVDMCNATAGRLVIQPDGSVTVQQESTETFSEAQCFTSLEGVSFVANPFTTIPPQNGWGNYGNGTGPLSSTIINGYVTLSGAIQTSGTDATAFTLPAGEAPPTDVYETVDTVNGTTARIHVAGGTGVVDIEATTFSNASDFTSLEGVSFALSETGSTALPLVNGWTNAPFSTSNAAAKDVAGIIHLQGAVSGGTTGQITTLPASMRPATNVYVPADLCGAVYGRLLIQPSGAVTVQENGSSLSDAECFTSLDGITFAPSTAYFSNLGLVNGWTNAPYSTSNAQYHNIDGVIQFKGAIASGTTGVAFTLPSVNRPTVTVYIPVDMCNATDGRLVIAPTGVVTVEQDINNPFSDATCFTSLDGAWFAQAN